MVSGTSTRRTLHLVARKIISEDISLTKMDANKCLLTISINVYNFSTFYIGTETI